jgi:hypothetical protein
MSTSPDNKKEKSANGNGGGHAGRTSSKKKSSTYRPTGATTLTGSKHAKRLTAGILEVLCGLRSAGEGAEALGISLPRYYVLETRALQGLIDALEPLPRGRQKKPADIIEDLHADKARLEREIGRLQSLVRVAQRAVGLPAAESMRAPSKRKSKATASGTKKKRRRHTNRAGKAVAALRKQVEDAPDDGDDDAPGSYESDDAGE